MEKIGVSLEVGQKRVFASADRWPGWCRNGRDEPSALQALHEYGPRYAEAIRSSLVEFHLPSDVSEFVVAERLEGSATTDFGAPGKIPSSDQEPLDDDELGRLQDLLQAIWQAFDASVRKATGKELRKGPRGGGRELKAIIQHVQGSDSSYLAQLGYKLDKQGNEGLGEEGERLRQAILDALVKAARGELPAKGPRGGVRWPPLYFARRSAWHVLDHAWEIEDRIL